MPDNNKLTYRELTTQNSTEIRALNKRMANQESAQKSMHDDIKTLLNHIQSDPTTKTEGVVEKSNRHDKEIKIIETRYSNLKAMSAVVSFFVTSIISFVVWVLNR